MGLVLTFAGLHAMRERTPLLPYPPYLSLAEQWSQLFRLEISNLPNFLIGLLVMPIGVAITVSCLELSSWSAEPPVLRLPRPTPVRWQYVWPLLLGSLGLYALLILQLGNHGYSDVSLLLWLIPVLGLTLLFWKREREASTELSLQITRQDGAWMLLLFALGIGIGCFRLDDVPAWVAGDEGAFWGTAQSIATGEFKLVFFDFGVYSFPVASSIAQAWVLRLAGMDLWGWRFASVLSGCLAIFPLYLLGRELFDRRVAIFASTVMIFNPYFLAFARLGYNNSQALLPVVLSAYLLILGLKRGSHFYLWLAGLAAGLGYYTYFAAWLGVVVIGILILSLSLTTRIPFRNALPLLLVPLAGWFAVSLPRAVYSLSSPLVTSMYYKALETSFVSAFYGRVMFGDGFMNQAPTWSPGEVEVFFGIPQYGILIMRGILRSVAALFIPLFNTGHFLTAELSGPGASFFFAIGAGIAMAGLRKIRGCLLSTWFWIGLLFLSVLSAFPPRPNHGVPLIPAMALLVALGLVAVLEEVAKRIPGLAAHRRRWVTGAAALGLLIMAGMGYHAYFIGVPTHYPADFDHSASWIVRHAPASAMVVFVDEIPTPHDAEFQSETHLADREIITASRVDTKAITGQIAGRDFLVFVAAEHGGEQVAEELTRLLPEATLQRILNPSETTLGFVVSSMQVSTGPSGQLADGLRDLWASPARAVILASVIAGVILLAIGWRTPHEATETVSPFHSRISGLRIRWPVLDIEFRFRIHFRPRSRSEPGEGKKRQETNH